MVTRLFSVPKRLLEALADLDIRVKIIGLAVGSVLVLGAAATLYTYSVTSRLLRDDLLHESTQMAEAFSEKISQEINTPFLEHGSSSVEQILTRHQQKDPLMRYAFVMGLNGSIIAGTFGDAVPYDLAAANNVTSELQPHVRILPYADGRVWDAAYPIVNGERIDIVRMGYSEEEARHKLYSVIVEQVIVTAGMATLALIVAFLLGSFLARQIKVLARAASAVAAGQVGHQVIVYSRDDLGRLANSFNDMSVKLAQTKNELEKRETIRRHLLVKIMKSQEEERVRVARDLHDNFGQTISSLGYMLESASHILETDPVKAKSVIDSIREENIHAQHELRATIYALRPSVLDDLGLLPALRSYAKTRLSPNGVEVDFNTSGKPRRLSPEIETALFRIGQEALNNVARHAKARIVHVGAAFGPDSIDIDITDDGRGFDAPVLQGRPGEQVGILGMRERAELLGGKLSISSQPGKGCRIAVHIPFIKEKEVSYG